MTPIAMNLLFHPNPRGVFDVYLGGGAAYVRFSDLGRIRGGSERIPDQVTWNAEIGLDIKFGDGRFGLNLNGSYLDARASEGYSREIDVLPFNLGATLSCHW